MLKKILLAVFLGCLLVPAHAEVIRSFDSTIRLHKDATLDVNETIVMDFQGAGRHGIYRDIPVKYERHNNTFSIHLKLLSITNQKDQPITYKSSHQGRNLHIRIGDADTLITGVQTYKLHYQVLRAVNFFDGAPEVYWNATGNDWLFPIQQATARFYPPENVDLSQIKVTSFFGPPGATQPASSEIETNDIVFHTENLEAGEGLTFVAGLPEGSVVPPSIAQTFWWYFQDWWPAFVVPLVILLILVALYLNGGRDIDGGQAVAVEWAPPSDMSPAEVGTLIDEHCDMSDIIATLLDLAARGYLQIHENEKKGFLFLSSKDYTFVRNAPDPAGDELARYEREFLDGIFQDVSGGSLEASLAAVIAAHQQARPQSAPPPKQGGGAQAFGLSDPVGLMTAGTVKMDHQETTTQPVAPATPVVPQPTEQAVQLSDLKNKFYTRIPSIRTHIYQELMNKSLFVRNPEQTRGMYRTAAIVCGAIGIILFSNSIPWAIGLLISALFLFLSAKAMPAKTAKGSRKLRECEGFARFVRLVEKPRLEMMYQENPEIFGRLLPYAVVLGVADQWAEGFEGLMQEPPSWYFPASYGTGYMFSSRMFVNDMGNGLNTMSSTFQSAPSSAGSGGSGFSGGGSGGGFGGGGGGSW